ncbi:hypothetical protein [Flavobacterium galactosidilyticum]|nr:hypothetical protein [Flavobacterium sp. F-340]
MDVSQDFSITVTIAGVDKKAINKNNKRLANNFIAAKISKSNKNL